MVNFLNFRRSVLTNLRSEFQLLHYFWRNMCISKFVPLNLYSDSIQRERDIKQLYKISTTKFKPTREEILCKLLDLKENEVKNLLEKNKTLMKYDSPEYSHTIDLVKKFLPNSYRNVDKKFWISVLKQKPTHLQHRFCFLKEIEIPATDKNLFMLKTIRNQCIKDLGNKSIISTENFPHKIFCELEAPQRILNSLPSSKECEETKLKDLYRRLSWTLLSWQLGISYEEFLKVDESCNKHILSSISLNLQFQNIVLLKKYFQLRKEEIARNIYLLTLAPEHLMQYINYKEKVWSTDIVTLVKMVPLLLLKPLYNIQEISAILEFINLKMDGTDTCGRVLLLSKRTLLERIAYCVRKTSLDDFRLTPSNVYYLSTKMIFSKYIESYERENGCIRSLPSGSCIGVSLSNYVSNSTTTMRNFICFFFKWHFNIKKYDCCKSLQQISVIHLPEIHNLKQNLVFLLNKDFSMDLIKGSYQILIYPHLMVVETFNNLSSTTKYADFFWENNDRHKLLQLLLYKTNKAYRSLGGCNT